MPRGNPTNPHAADKSEVERFAPMPVQRAVVTNVNKRENDSGGVHTARVRVYGDPSPYRATVIAPSRGDVNIPTEGDDVAVVFGEREKPFIIGYWYAVDKVEDDRVHLPDYEPGDRIIGAPGNTSHIAVRKDGSIDVSTEDDQPVNIDHHSMAAFLGTDQSIAGDNQYYKIDYDTEDDDPNDIFDTSTGEVTVKAGGQHEVKAAIEITAAGQNNLYTLSIFVNGTLIKRKNRQSVVNEPLSLDVDKDKNLSEGDVVDIRLKQNSGSSKTVTGVEEATDFSVKRTGI